MKKPSFFSGHELWLLVGCVFLIALIVWTSSRPVYDCVHGAHSGTCGRVTTTWVPMRVGKMVVTQCVQAHCQCTGVHR